MKEKESSQFAVRSSQFAVRRFLLVYLIKLKKIYPNHFRSKISDADAECSETIIWLRMAKDFEHIDEDVFNDLTKDYMEVGRMLGGMVRHPEKFV